MTANLAGIARALGLDLTVRQLEQLAAFRDSLATAELNLVSARDRDQIEARHLAESLACGQVLATHGLLPDGARVLDLGAGGGLPGIPIKIVWPGIDLTLLEATGKKCRFLEETAHSIGLMPVGVLEGRAEELGRDASHRGRYDLVVARAVAALPVLLEYALPFLRPGGHLAALKGSTASDELADAAVALRELGGHHVASPTFDPPFGQRQTVLLIAKDGPTPERYPRRAGIPTKRPLG